MKWAEVKTEKKHSLLVFAIQASSREREAKPFRGKEA